MALNSYLSSLFKNNTPTYSSLSGLKGTTPSLSLPSLSPQQKAPTPQVTPSAPASVSPTSPTPTPASSPKNQYVNSVATTPQLGTPEYTQYLLQKGQSLGMNTGAFAGVPAASPAPMQQAPAPTPAPATDPMTSYLESYRDYLSQYADSLKPSDELKAARSRLGEIQSKIDERSLKARRDYEATLDARGGTLAGANQSANVLNRRYASELADLGVAESGAARGLAALTQNAEGYSSALKTALELGKPLEIAGNLYDPMSGKLIGPKDPKKDPEGFSLSEGQQRYEYDPVTKQYKLIASAPKTFAPKDGTGTGAGEMSPYQAERAYRTVQSVDELMAKADASPSIFGRSAAVPLPGALRSDAFRNFKSELDTLKAAIAFGELTAMREASKTGGALGQVSNIELGLLESALGALNMSQSPENFKAQLQKVKDSINRWQAATGGVTSGQNSAPKQYQLPDGTIVTLQADGTYE